MFVYQIVCDKCDSVCVVILFYLSFQQMNKYKSLSAKFLFICVCYLTGMTVYIFAYKSFSWKLSKINHS